jgi:hypothetical protein
MLERLSERDRKIIVQCMEIVSEDQWYPGEMETRVGLDLRTLTNVIAAVRHLPVQEDKCTRGPNYGVRPEDIDLAVHNCLNEVCHGMDIDNSVLREGRGFDKDDVEAVFEAWKTLNNDAR